MLCRYLEEEHFRRWVGKHTVFRNAFCILYLQIYGRRPDCVRGPIMQGLGRHGEESGLI